MNIYGKLLFKDTSVTSREGKKLTQLVGKVLGKVLKNFP